MKEKGILHPIINSFALFLKLKVYAKNLKRKQQKNTRALEGTFSVSESGTFVSCKYFWVITTKMTLIRATNQDWPNDKLQFL